MPVRRTLFSALILMAAAGLMLHYRIHNFMVQDKIDPSVVTFDGTRFMASLLPLLDLVLVTALFASRKTAVYGYLLNGLLVIYGTVLMAHFSIADIVAHQIPLGQMALKSTLPDIAMAWGDFFLGKALYDSYMRGDAAQG
jgi:hypothetical protein